MHTYSNDVDYESVRMHNYAESTYVSLEFIGVSAPKHHMIRTSAWDLHQQKQVRDDADRVCYKGEDKQANEYTSSISFVLPVHFRYQPPVACGGDRATASKTETLHPPQVYIRTSNNSLQDFVAVAGGKRRVHWLYEETKLGGVGNYAAYNALYRGLHSYQPVMHSCEAAIDGVVFDVSTGCIEDMDKVVFGAGLTLVFTSIVVLFIIGIKLWHKMRTTRTSFCATI